MKLFFLSLLTGIFLLPTLQLHAQDNCRIVIPSDVTVFKKSPLTEKWGKNKSFWICNAAQVIFRGGNATIYAEDGVKLTVSQGNYTIYLRGNASVYVGTGAKYQIFHDIVHPNIRSTGFNARGNKFYCRGIFYDYTQAPSNLCPSINYTSPVNSEIPPPSIYAKDSTSTGDSPKTPPGIPNPDYPNLAEDLHIIPSVAQITPYKMLVKNTNNHQTTYWIQARAHQVHQGDGNIFYAEEGVKLTVTGNNNVIFLKTGSKISLGKGINNQLFYVEGVELLENQSTKTKFTKLNQLEYDYSQAPLVEKK